MMYKSRTTSPIPANKYQPTMGRFSGYPNWTPPDLGLRRPPEILLKHVEVHLTRCDEKKPSGSAPSEVLEEASGSKPSEVPEVPEEVWTEVEITAMTSNVESNSRPKPGIFLTKTDKKVEEVDGKDKKDERHTMKTRSKGRAAKPVASLINDDSAETISSEVRKDFF